MCPRYNVGDEFAFYRDDVRDDFWHMGINTLTQTIGDADAISCCIYTGLQGGSIMKGWRKRENEMITCCSDEARPVTFKIERIDCE